MSDEHGVRPARIGQHTAAESETIFTQCCCEQQIMSVVNKTVEKWFYKLGSRGKMSWNGVGMMEQCH